MVYKMPYKVYFYTMFMSSEEWRVEERVGETGWNDAE